MKTLLSLSLLSGAAIARMADDGTGSGSVSGVANGGAPNLNTSSGDVSKSLGTVGTSTEGDDNSFDGVLRRLAAVEGDVKSIQNAPKPVAVPGDAEAGQRVGRMETILGKIFGREFAEYDENERVKAAAATGTGNGAV